MESALFPFTFDNWFVNLVPLLSAILNWVIVLFFFGRSYKNFSIHVVTLFAVSLATWQTIYVSESAGLTSIQIFLVFLAIFLIIAFVALTRLKFLHFTPSIATDTIVETLEDMLLIADAKSTLHFVNSATQKILGIQKEKAESYSIKDLFISELQAYQTFNFQVTQPVLNGASISGFTCFFETSKGKKIPVLISAAPISLGANEPLGILIVAHDITNRREYEESLRTTNAKLEEEKAVLTSIGDGLVTTNKEERVTMINKQAEELLGISSKDVIGKKFSELQELQDEDGTSVPVHKRPMYLALLHGKKVTNSAYYLVRSDKTRLPIALTASPVIFKDTIIGAIAVFRDISREKEIDRAKTEFVSLASHQLRTPPAIIKWYVELLLMQNPQGLNDKQKKYLQEINQATKRMIDLVNALLNVSRLELGTFIMKPQDVSVADIIKDVLAELKPDIQRRNLVMSETYEENSPAVRTDPQLLTIIFQSLISNAIRHTPHGGNINVVLTHENKLVTIRISDTGSGILRAQRAELFNKPFGTSATKMLDSQGSGLGLYIVKTILDKIGGKITFTSQEHEGTTFAVSLPVV